MVNKAVAGIAIIAVFIVIAAIYYLSSPAQFQVVPQTCEETNIGIACASDQTCIDYFKTQGAPDEWLNSQQFACKSNQCYVTPSAEECQSTFVEVD